MGPAAAGGLTPDDLQADLAAESHTGDDDLAVAMDAAVRAARVVSLADDPTAEIDHLL